MVVFRMKRAVSWCILEICFVLVTCLLQLCSVYQSFKGFPHRVVLTPNSGIIISSLNPVSLLRAARPDVCTPQSAQANQIIPSALISLHRP
jgi:hypothetical protein